MGERQCRKAYIGIRRLRDERRNGKTEGEGCSSYGTLKWIRPGNGRAVCGGGCARCHHRPQSRSIRCCATRTRGSCAAYHLGCRRCIGPKKAAERLKEDFGRLEVLSCERGRGRTETRRSMGQSCA